MPPIYPSLPTGLRVMVADDSCLMRAFIDKVLAHLKVACVPCEDGLEVLDLCLRLGERPDLLLIDWHMPVLGGRSVIEVLRAHPATRAMPIILMSGSQEPELSRVGVDAFLLKPFKVGDLAETLGRVLARRAVAASS